MNDSQNPLTLKKNIYALLEEAYKLYKKNFSDFILFGIGQSLIGIISIYVLKMIGDELIIIYLPIGLILFYFDLRLAATFVLLAYDRHRNINDSISEYYNKSKLKIWEYLGATLMFAFIGAIAIGISAAILYFTDNLFIKILVVVAGGGLTLYLATYYFLAPIIILLDQESEVAFKESRVLIKPVRFMALFVMLVSLLLPATPSFLFDFLELPITISSLLEITTNAFLAPLSLSFVIIFYHKLTNRKVEPEEREIKNPVGIQS